MPLTCGVLAAVSSQLVGAAAGQLETVEAVFGHYFNSFAEE
jgi:hypothetical protein